MCGTVPATYSFIESHAAQCSYVKGQLLNTSASNYLENVRDLCWKTA